MILAVADIATTKSGPGMIIEDLNRQLIQNQEIERLSSDQK